MTRHHTTSRRLLGVVLAGLVVTAGLLLPATPAHAETRVTIRNDRGGSDADLTYSTSFTVNGSGFQAVRGGFGGIYLAFGWVRDPGGGAWRPSRGGVTGDDYRYVPDSETENNAGYLRFVAFPGSSTAGEAHATMNGNGSFEVDLAVPGPVFTSQDRDGGSLQVDCRRVTCGVITFGAHGVKNPSNESFTPVDFSEVYDSDPGGDPQGGDAPDAGRDTGSSGAATGQDGAAQGRGASPAPDAVPGRRSGATRVAVDRATAQAGHAMTFTASGFTPGEQVVAVLDDGLASVGPLTAGAAGEVAGVLPIPTDVSAGTHTLRVSGAASGARAQQRFPITGAAVPETADTEEAAAGPGLPGDPSAGLVFVVLAAALFLVIAVVRVAGMVRRRRRRRLAPAGVAPVAVTP